MERITTTAYSKDVCLILEVYRAVAQTSAENQAELYSQGQCGVKSILVETICRAESCSNTARQNDCGWLRHDDHPDRELLIREDVSLHVWQSAEV